MSTFRATGKGFHNSLPHAPADAATGSAMLKDSVSGKKLWLYVTDVSTSWSLQGSKSQTQARSTFYPQHVTQELLVVRGQCANQFEYDRIVEFITRHHRNSLGLVGDNSGAFGSSVRSSPFDRGVNRGNDGVNPNGSRIGLDFMLVPQGVEGKWISPPEGSVDDRLSPEVPNYRTKNASQRIPEGALQQDKGIYRMPKVHVAGIVTEIRAGAKKFQFAPEFEFGLKVVHDYQRPLYDDLRSVQNAMKWYMQGLGTQYKEPLTADPGQTTYENVLGIVEGVTDMVEPALELGEDIWNAIGDALP